MTGRAENVQERVSQLRKDLEYCVLNSQKDALIASAIQDAVLAARLEEAHLCNTFPSGDYDDGSFAAHIAELEAEAARARGGADGRT